jgi:hypothetical protein
MENKKYNCKSCDYSTNSRQSWYQHTRSIKHKNKEKETHENSYLIENIPMEPPCVKEGINQVKEGINQVKKDKFEKKYTCEYCNKKFTRKDNLVIHKTTRCKVFDKIEQDKKLEEQRKLDEERKEMERKLEEQRKLDEERKEMERKLDEERKEMERKLEEQRKLDEERKGMGRKLEELEKKLNDERKEMERKEMERKNEQKRIEDKNEIMHFLMEQQKKADEERRIEQIRRDEEQRKLFEVLLSQKGCNPYQNDNSELKEEIEELKKIIKENKPLDQSHNTNNSGTYFEAQTQNNLLNNLNLNYNNVISMDQFLYNMEHVNKIPKSDLEAIAYASTNMSEAALAETIHKTIEKNVIDQTKGVINPADGLELLPVMPVVCSDGNCRSHKEKVNEFWETVYGDKHFDHMLNIIDKRLYEVLKKKIYLEEYGKRKLFKKIKKKHTIHDMKNIQQKVNGDLLDKKFKNTYAN